MDSRDIGISVANMSVMIDGHASTCPQVCQCQWP